MRKKIDDGFHRWECFPTSTVTVNGAVPCVSMQGGETYIPPFVRQAMKGATEEELVAAADNLRRYLKVMYTLFRELEAEKARGDSLEFVSDDRLKKGADQPPRL